MADAMDSLGGKRKFSENPLTAMAESGSLKIKISRKDGQNGGRLGLGMNGSFSGTGAIRSPVHGQARQVAGTTPSAQQQQQSPPKPRPNRKHVPIFYQRPNAFDISTTSSTDESMTQSTSVTSDYDDQNYSTASTSSAAGRFSRLQLGGSSDNLMSNLPPLSNPLFSRESSDSGSVLVDILRNAMPANAPLLPFDASDPGHGVHQSASALHQLAMSSTTYGTLSRSDSSSHSETAPSSYRFDPMSALQSAVKMAAATTYHNPHHTISNFARPYSGMDASMGGDDDGDLGPPPTAPPAFAVQHSLMGGGIESQPMVIANVNTRNFDWGKGHNGNGTGRPRSGSLPSVFIDENSESNEHGHAPVHLWKEV